MRQGVVMMAVLLAAGSLCAAAAGAPTPRRAFVLDMSDPANASEALMAVCLQGIVNRDAPRLFFRTHFWVNQASDDTWLDYLSHKKGFQFEHLGCLDEAVEHFRDEGLIKGLVVYDPARYADSCVAATLAAQEDLLPVTSDMLAYRTPLLAGLAGRVGEDLSREGWRDWFVDPRITPNGLVATVTRDNAPAFAGVQRWVRLDLDRTPFLEIDTAQAVGSWGVRVNTGVRDPDAPWVVGPTDRTGVFRVDLRRFLKHGADRAQIRICPLGKGSSLTVRSLRLLGPSGKPAPDLASPTGCFQGMRIVEDLRGRFKDDDSAYAWALKTLFPTCSRSMAFHAMPGWWNMMGADLAVSRKAFIFYENRQFGENYPLFNEVLGRLKKPAGILGWGDPEWIYTWRTSQLGHYVLCSGAPNLSFWAHVPTDGPASLPATRLHSGRLQAKYYVTFYIGDGDAPKTIAGVQNGDWMSPDRGKVPIAWGMQPALMDLCPALVEFYRKTASPMDSFFAGPSGAGYTYPSTMPDLDLFAQHSRRCMDAAGLSAVDLWDLVKLDLTGVNEAYTRPSKYAPVQCFLEAPPGAGWKATNMWMDDGTPVLIAQHTQDDHDLWAMSLDQKDPAGDLARRIEAVAAAHEPPFFILAYQHLSPTLCREVTRLLPADRFQVIGSPDLEALAREAGSLTVIPDRIGTGPGESVSLDLVLHNPDGLMSHSGLVTWKLPDGWSAKAQSWKHGPVPKGGSLSHRLVVTCPNGQVRETVRISFHDTGLPWNRSLRIERYPESRVIATFAHAEAWTLANGATLTVKDGVGTMSGTGAGSRLSRPVQADFDRRPILAVNVPRADAKWGLGLRDAAGDVWLMKDSPLSGRLTFDLARLTGWKGHRSFDLFFCPSVSLGTTMEASRVELYYPTGPAVAGAGR